MTGRRWNVFGKLALCTVIESLAFVIPIAIASQLSLRCRGYPVNHLFGEENFYYQATDDVDDLGKDWVNHQISHARRNSVKSKYLEPLRTLKASFTIEETVWSFTIHVGLPADLELTIIAFPVKRNAGIYFLEKENHASGWTAGETYSFDVTEYEAYRYIYLSATVDDETFHLVNSFALWREDRKTANPRDRFFDCGILERTGQA